MTRRDGRHKNCRRIDRSRPQQIRDSDRHPPSTQNAEMMQDSHKIRIWILVLLSYISKTYSWSLIPWSIPWAAPVRVRKAKSLLRHLKQGKSIIHPAISVVSVGRDECGIQFRVKANRQKWWQFGQKFKSEQDIDEVIFVDREEFLTSRSGLETPIGRALELYLSRPENAVFVHPDNLPRIYLALYLIAYKRGLLPSISASAYLETLPSDAGIQHLPIFWDDAMLQELQFSNVKQTVFTRRKEWSHELVIIKKAMEASNLPDEMKSLSSKDWFWARSIVTSRAFTDASNKGEPCLCPYVDMMNHVTASQSKQNRNVLKCTWEIDSNGYHLRLPTNRRGTSRGSDPAERCSNSTIDGALLEISYGSRSNGHLLMNYGFSILDDSDQMADEEVTLPVILPNSVNAGETEALWEADGLGNCHSVPRNVKLEIGEAGPMQSVLSLCRVASTKDQELSNMRTAFAKCAERSVYGEDGLVPQLGATLCRFPFSKSNEIRALEMLQNATQTALDSYETTMAEDSSILQGKTDCKTFDPKELSEEDSSQLRNAITVRRGEKRILQHYHTLAGIGLSILEVSGEDIEDYKGMLEVSLEDSEPFPTFQ